jgi:hypothetical protein
MYRKVIQFSEALLDFCLKADVGMFSRALRLHHELKKDGFVKTDTVSTSKSLVEILRYFSNQNFTGDIDDIMASLDSTTVTKWTNYITG